LVAERLPNEILHSMEAKFLGLPFEI